MGFEPDRTNMSNPFWDFSLSNYNLPGVAATCLSLQDECDLDVNVLLYAAWVATMDRRLTEQHVAEMERIIAPWRERVVRPLRALRRQWRDCPQASGLRDTIKQLELQAERQQQDMMSAFYAAAGRLPSAARPTQQNLSMAARCACPDDAIWGAAVRRLVSHLNC
jgi:uncharacterized protein (TIGR02444 family)